MRNEGIAALLAALLLTPAYADKVHITFAHLGRPVVHAKVSAQLAFPGQPLFVQDRVTGDDGGVTFDLGRIVAGSAPLTGVVCAPNDNYYLFSAFAKDQRLDLTGPLSRVTVRVRDRHGRPVPGARVVGTDATLGDGSTGVIRDATRWHKADQGGLVFLGCFPTGAQISLDVESPGFVSMSHNFEFIGSGKHVIDQTLAKTGYISGRLLRDGRPVKGAEVTGSYEASPFIKSSVQAKSQADGTYRLGAPAGRCAVSANIPGSDVTADGPSDIIVVEGKELGHVNFQFRQGIPVRVHITNREDRAPVANVSVRVSAGPDSSVKTTGQDGYVTFHVRPGQVFFAVDSVYRFTHANLGSSWVTVSKDRHPDVQFTVPKAMTASPVSHLSGKVTNLDGSPAKSARVTVLEAQGRARLDAVTDSHGAFRFLHQIAEGSHVMAKLGRKVSRPVEIRSERIGLVLSAAEATLSGVVVDERGDPMNGVMVSLNSKGSQSVVHSSVYTDRLGRYRFDGLAGDLDSLYVWCARQGYASGTIESIKVAPGEDKILPKQALQPTDGFIAGIVVDVHGRPVPNVRVTGQSRGGSGNAISDLHGRFVLNGLTRGKVSVAAWLDATKQVVVEANTGEENTVVKLDPARSGTPEALAMPQIRPQRAITVDPDGSRSFAFLFLASMGGVLLALAFGIRQLALRGKSHP